MTKVFLVKMKLILIIVIVFIELIINVRALDNKSLVAVHLVSTTNIFLGFIGI